MGIPETPLTYIAKKKSFTLLKREITFGQTIVVILEWNPHLLAEHFKNFRVDDPVQGQNLALHGDLVFGTILLSP
jgi:hypothetical protein